MKEIAATPFAVNVEPLAAALPPPERHPKRIFVRYPEELAATTRVPLRPSERVVLQNLILMSDDDGKSWPATKTLAAMPGRSGPRPTYALPTILVALRRLRDLGLIAWDRIFPNERFPEPGKPGTVGPDGRRRYLGKWTWRGGRVWRANLAKLREIAGLKPRRVLRRPTLRKLAADSPAPPAPRPAEMPSAEQVRGEAVRERPLEPVAPWPSTAMGALWEALGVSRKHSGHT